METTNATQESLLPVPLPSKNSLPSPPKGISAEEQLKAQNEAAAMAKEVIVKADDLSVGRQLGALGADVEQAANQELSLLNERLGKFMTDLNGSGSKIPQNLVALRKVMDQINPHTRLSELKNPKGIQKFIPRVLRRAPVIGEILADIAHNLQSVKSQIDYITSGLLSGRDTLLQDNISLEQLYAKVKRTDAEVKLVAYKGELLWNELEKQKNQASDPDEIRQLDALIGKVARRVQDLRTMEQVFQQFYASIQLTVENNNNLMDSIQRTVVVTGNVLTIGLSLQVARQHQKKIAEAVKSTQEYTGQLLADNAAAIRQGTTEIGQMQNNAVVPLEKVEAAFTDLMGAMDEAERLRTANTEQIRENLSRLKHMTNAMESKVGALQGANQAQNLLGNGGL